MKKKQFIKKTRSHAFKDELIVFFHYFSQIALGILQNLSIKMSVIAVFDISSFAHLGSPANAPKRSAVSI